MTKSELATVGVHEAKTQLSKLLERVIAGEEIQIMRRGEVVARIVPDGAQIRRRTLGAARGTVTMSPDFDDPMPADFLAYFE